MRGCSEREQCRPAGMGASARCAARRAGLERASLQLSVSGDVLQG